MKLAVSFREAVQKTAIPNMLNAKLTARRKFNRLMFRPTMGAATKVKRPTGATARPAHVAVYPTVVCSHNGNMMLTPVKAKKEMPMRHVATRKLRRLNKCRSMTGCLSVSSHEIRNVRLTSEMTDAVIMTGELNQSFSLPLSSMNCRLPTPMISKTSPTASMGCLIFFDSRLRKIDQLAAADNAPTGKLM